MLPHDILMFYPLVNEDPGKLPHLPIEDYTHLVWMV